MSNRFHTQTMLNNTVSVVVLGAGKPFSGEQHTPLRSVGGNARVLDWTLNTFATFLPEPLFVTGYQAEAIRASYPNFSFRHNNDWESTRAGWSLLIGLPEKDRECFVSYSDVLYRVLTVEQLMQTKSDVTFFYIYQGISN